MALTAAQYETKVNTALTSATARATNSAILGGSAPAAYADQLIAGVYASLANSQHLLDDAGKTASSTAETFRSGAETALNSAWTKAAASSGTGPVPAPEQAAQLAQIAAIRAWQFDVTNRREGSYA